LFREVDRAGGGCDVRGSSITIWVAQTPQAAQRIRDMPDPQHWFSVNWVVGPNWFVATIRRDAAVAVQHAIGGELRGIGL
jgi:hypothetical protein